MLDWKPLPFFEERDWPAAVLRVVPLVITDHRLRNAWVIYLLQMCLRVGGGNMAAGQSVPFLKRKGVVSSLGLYMDLHTISERVPLCPCQNFPLLSLEEK